MERKRVNSSKIRAVGYDAASGTMEVEFSDGHVNAYRGVSPEIHRSFMNSPSPNSFFEDRIEEDFKAERVK
jgi:hypothetical protein